MVVINCDDIWGCTNELICTLSTRFIWRKNENVGFCDDIVIPGNCFHKSGRIEKLGFYSVFIYCETISAEV